MTLDRHHLAAARLWAANRFPYLATALFAANVIERPGLGGDGVSVDSSWRLYVDPEQASVWTVEELGSLLIHHTGHLIRDHAGRAETMGITSSSAERWSTAADAELNDDLADIGLSMPGQNILPEDHGWERGRMAEEYFHLESSDEEAPQSDHGSGSHGHEREWEDPPEDDPDSERPPGLSNHERELLRAQTAQEMLEAVRTGQGNVPGSWKRWAEELLRPTVDWRRALAAEVRRGVQAVAGAVDYSYRRPSRRASTSPSIVLPSLEKPVPEVAVVCDTSGSMGERVLPRVLAEVEGLLSSIGLRSGGVRVLAVDTAVNAVRRVSTARQVELIGGGGTDMGRGIEAAAALKPRPSVLVVLTDGLTPWPAEGPRGVRVVIGLLTGAAPGTRPFLAADAAVGARRPHRRRVSDACERTISTAGRAACHRVDVPVDCGGERHLVRFRRGSIVLADHSIAAEAAAVALGAPTTACFDVYRSWRSREQWEIALQPRGPGFHQLYRRPPLPKPLLEPLERGIARGWERRAARGEGLAGYVLQRAVRAKAEPALESSFSSAVRRLGGGPVQRLELTLGASPEVRGTIAAYGSWLVVRVTPDWLRDIGLARRAVVDREFVVALHPCRTLVGWREDGPPGTWRAELVERP